MKQLVYKYRVNIGAVRGNYQWKEPILNIYQTHTTQEEMNQNLNLIDILVMATKNMLVINMLTWLVYSINSFNYAILFLEKSLFGKTLIVVQNSIYVLLKVI